MSPNCLADLFVLVSIDKDTVAAKGDGVIGMLNRIHTIDVINPEVWRFWEGFLEDNVCVEVCVMETFEGNGLCGIVEVIIAFEEFSILVISHVSCGAIRNNPDVSPRQSIGSIANISLVRSRSGVYT